MGPRWAEDCEPGRLLHGDYFEVARLSSAAAPTTIFLAGYPADRGKAAARLNDPGIIMTMLVGRHEEQFAFVVTEHLEGRTLRAVRRELSPAMQWRVLADAAAALGRAHTGRPEGPCTDPAPTAHGKLTPSSLLVPYDERRAVTVVGFGTARAVTECSPADPYVAPELLGRSRAEPPPPPTADVYALGVMLWEAATGAPAAAFGRGHALYRDPTYAALPAPSSVASTRLPARVDEVGGADARAPRDVVRRMSIARRAELAAYVEATLTALRTPRGSGRVVDGN